MPGSNINILGISAYFMTAPLRWFETEKSSRRRKRNVFHERNLMNVFRLTRSTIACAKEELLPPISIDLL